jgi:uncharacterized protein
MGLLPPSRETSFPGARPRLPDARLPGSTDARMPAVIEAEIPVARPTRGALQAIEPRNRIGLIDSIRGLAVFGILWVNVFLRSDPIQLNALPADHDWLNWFVALSGTLKFRSMFAFLFGLGMAMQASRARDDRAFVRAYIRRLSILLLFGVAHFAFLWPGDILAMYAVAGMVLVGLRKASIKVLLAIGFTFLLLAMVQQVAGVRLFDPAALRADVASAYPIYQHGTFWQITQRRVYDYVVFWTPSLWVTFPGVFAMMVFGAVFERKKYFVHTERHPVVWRRLCWIGYLIGIPTNALFATWSIASSRTASFTLLAKLAQAVGAPVLCMAYVATLVVLSHTGVGRRVHRSLEAVGRMSITAYLGHSVASSLLFYGYGLGWFGKVGNGQDVAICFALFAVEVAFANAWFLFFRMGPVEWVWRWATYGSRPPFLARRVQAEVGEGAAG